MLLSIEPNIELRLIEEKDAGELFALVDKNRKYLRKFLGWVDFNQSESDSLGFIRNEREKAKRKEGMSFGIWASGLVGMITLYNVDHLNGTACIGFWLAERVQGRGIMGKCCERVVRYAFETLQRIEIRCAVGNEKSQKVIERLGFEKEGLLKGAIAHYGERFDAHLYAKLSSCR